MNPNPKNILIAPLNWGLGHASRCIPIIHALIKEEFNPIIASDGAALHFLKKEFPDLIHIELPSYQVEYPKEGQSFKWKLIRNLPDIILSAKKEYSLVKDIIKKHNIQGIISDNRLGVYNKKVPSIYITHQLQVLTGKTTSISTELHQYVIKKFDECWVPDAETRPNLSGKLGHLKKTLFPTKYIGALSRFQKKDIPLKYKLLVLLSGPEPQRDILEKKIISELKNYIGKILFVKGIVEDKQVVTKVKNTTYYNYMSSEQLDTALNESAIVLARSGYSTIMDLATIEKKAFLIPTPGQYEQEYLAQKLQKNGIVPTCSQEDFTIDLLHKAHIFEGLKNNLGQANWSKLFDVFKSKNLAS